VILSTTQLNPVLPVTNVIHKSLIGSRPLPSYNRLSVWEQYLNPSWRKRLEAGEKCIMRTFVI